MSDQAWLWGNDGLPPHQRHSDTSRTAAVAVEPKAGTLRAIVLAWLRNRGDEGGTDEEMQSELQMRGDTQRPRRGELYKAGLIRPNGKKRITLAGNHSVVWVAVQQQSI